MLTILGGVYNLTEHILDNVILVECISNSSDICTCFVLITELAVAISGNTYNWIFR